MKTMTAEIMNKTEYRFEYEGRTIDYDVAIIRVYDRDYRQVVTSMVEPWQKCNKWVQENKPYLTILASNHKYDELEKELVEGMKKCGYKWTYKTKTTVSQA